MKRFKCELLSSRWLSNATLLAELSHWLRVMRRPQGWHYDMDESWVLQHLQDASLPVGSTILDAGAGMGVMQYVLAARGYNVISLDFGKRAAPTEARGIFKIALEEQERFEYKHPYQEYMSFTPPGTGPAGGPNGEHALMPKLSKLLSKRPYYRLKRETQYLYSNRLERLRDHSRFGQITFVRAAFHDIPYPDCHFDAVVSISALEHADTKLLGRNLDEMVRIAKRDAPVLITTSATGGEEDFFHEKTQGWCFSSGTTDAYAGNARSEYARYSEVEQSILASDIWRSRLDSYYHLDDSSDFYKKRMRGLPYLPLALSREK